MRMSMDKLPRYSFSSWSNTGKKESWRCSFVCFGKVRNLIAEYFALAMWLDRIIKKVFWILFTKIPTSKQSHQTSKEKNHKISDCAKQRIDQANYNRVDCNWLLRDLSENGRLLFDRTHFGQELLLSWRLLRVCSRFPYQGAPRNLVSMMGGDQKINSYYFWHVIVSTKKSHVGSEAAEQYFRHFPPSFAIDLATHITQARL